MRPQDLKYGSVSTSARRGWTFVSIVVAVGLRLWTHFQTFHAVPSPQTSVRDFFFSSEWPWVEPPLPNLVLSLANLFHDPVLFLLIVELIAVVTVVVLLLRLGERWLDFRAGLLGALIWAACAPAVAVFRESGSEGWQAALAMLVAASMLRISRRRSVEKAWQIGALSGVLTLFSGGGGLWALSAIAWLPVTSNRFRGRGWLRTSMMIIAGWLIVVLPVVLRNAITSGGDPKLPVAGEFALFHAAMDQATLAVELPSPETRPPSVAYTDSVLVAAGYNPDTSEWTRSTRMLTEALQRGSEEGSSGWDAIGRRLWAATGGWTHHEPVRGLAWPLISIVAWVGVSALLPGIRFLFPLLVGGLIPLLQGSLIGLDAGTTLLGTPFVCLYAGYGTWRFWTGRRWPLTWIVVPVVLAFAILVHLASRSWV